MSKIDVKLGPFFQSRYYSKTCVKQPIKKDKTKILMTKGSLMKKTNFRTFWEWLFYTGLTVKDKLPLHVTDTSTDKKVTTFGNLNYGCSYTACAVWILLQANKYRFLLGWAWGLISNQCLLVLMSVTRILALFCVGWFKNVVYCTGKSHNYMGYSILVVKRKQTIDVWSLFC